MQSYFQSNSIYLFLLLIYITTCLWVMKRYYKRNLGVFQAPFIFSLASVLMMTPQFCVIIFNPYYDSELLWDLTYCMVTCTLALSFGWEKAQTKVVTDCCDINLRQSKIVFFILFMIGFYCAIQSYGQVLEHFASGESDIRGNHTYQVLLFFMIYFDFGMFYALTYVIKEKKHSKLVILMLVIASLYYLFIILVLARRTIVVKLFLSLGLLLSMIRPKCSKKVKIFIVLFFTFGTVYQASISNIRGNLHSDTEDRQEINVWENYKESYYAPSLVHGMDLGNGALFIKHTKENYAYNFGLFLWDDIVTWYFPSFIFGKDGKQSLMMAGEEDAYIESITHNVSTETGYYQAFSAFGYLGFIMFYALGYLFGYVWKRTRESSLYLIVYLCFMFHIPSLASHGFSFVMGQIETFIIFCLPIIYRFTFLKRIQTNKIKNNE